MNETSFISPIKENFSYTVDLLQSTTPYSRSGYTYLGFSRPYVTNLPVWSSILSTSNIRLLDYKVKMNSNTRSFSENEKRVVRAPMLRQRMLWPPSRHAAICFRSESTFINYDRSTLFIFRVGVELKVVKKVNPCKRRLVNH